MELHPSVALAACFLVSHVLKFSYGRTSPDADAVQPMPDNEGVRLWLFPAALTDI